MCVKLATWRTFINLLGQCVCQQPSPMLHVSHRATLPRCDTRVLTVEEEYVRRRMTSYMVALVNRMVDRGVLCLDSGKTTAHDPYGWLSGALALLESVLKLDHSRSSLECMYLSLDTRIMIAMCVVMVVKFDCDIVHHDALYMVYCALEADDHIPGIRWMNKFVEEYEIYMLRAHNVFHCAQNNECVKAMRHLHRMRTTEYIDESTYCICRNSLVFFFFLLFIQNYDDVTEMSNALATLAVACADSADMGVNFDGSLAYMQLLNVATRVASLSPNDYSLARMTLEGTYLDETSREYLLTDRYNVLRARDLIRACLSKQLSKQR